MRKDRWMVVPVQLLLADDVVHEVELSLEHAIAGRFKAARDVLVLLELDDIAAVRSSRLAAFAAVQIPPRAESTPRRPRRSLSRQKLETFARDHWMCRLCGARTIDLRVLRSLSSLFPETIPFHPNWKFSESHLIYWTHSSSLEHVVPFARGGSDEPANFVTTCYACNDARGDLLLEEIGWTLQPVHETGWRGLTEYLDRMSPAVGSGSVPR